MDELEPRRPDAKFQLLDTGAVFDESMEFEDWRKAGVGLFEIHKMSAVWVGDWLCFGEKKWGETFSDALTITGLSLDSLAHYRSIMSRVPHSVRFSGGTLSHYRAVASLGPEDQKKFLDQAKEQKLSVRDLQALVESGTVRGRLSQMCGCCGASADLQIFRLCGPCADKVSKPKE